MSFLSSLWQHAQTNPQWRDSALVRAVDRALLCITAEDWQLPTTVSVPWSTLGALRYEVIDPEELLSEQDQAADNFESLLDGCLKVK